LNEAKAGDGEGTCLKSLRKITKYFVLDGRRIWLTEQNIVLLNRNTFQMQRRDRKIFINMDIKPLI